MKGPSILWNVWSVRMSWLLGKYRKEISLLDAPSIRPIPRVAILTKCAFNSRVGALLGYICKSRAQKAACLCACRWESPLPFPQPYTCSFEGEAGSFRYTAFDGRPSHLAGLAVSKEVSFGSFLLDLPRYSSPLHIQLGLHVQLRRRARLGTRVEPSLTFRRNEASFVNEAMILGQPPLMKKQSSG